MNGLLKKFIEFSIGNGIVLLLGFISSPIITRIISPDQYGKASMFTTFTSLIVLIATMGMDQAYIRYFNDEEDKNRGGLLGKSIGITLVLNVIIGVFILLFYKKASIFIVDEQSLFLVILILIHNTFGIIGNFSLIHVRMKQRGKAYSVITVINKVSYLIFIGIFYFLFKDHYLTIVIATILSNIVRMLWSIYIEKCDWKNVKRVNEVKTTTKELIFYGMPFIFSMAITWLFQSIDKVSLRIFSTYAEIGLYSGAMTIIGLLNNCQAAFTTFWTPVAYEKYSNNPEDTKFFTDANQIVTVAMIIISIWIIAAKDLIIKILGNDYKGAQFIFPFLVLMPIMYTISETTVLGINFMKKTKYHIYIATFSALSNIIGNLLLVPKYGARGAAISTGLAYVVFFITRTYYSRKFYNVKFYMVRFWISTALVYILASYSSVYKFDYIILLLSIFSTLLVLFLYREIIIKSLSMVVRKRK